MPIFSLQGARTEQVKNVAYNNFSYWSESATYGYYGGGNSGTTLPTVTNLINRLDFSSETLSNPGKNLLSAKYSTAIVKNNLYGYFGGGYLTPVVSTITRLDFSTETISDPGKNLVPARSDSTGTSSSSYGYFGGGYAPTNISTITRLDFSSETLSNPGKNLPSVLRYSATVSNTSYGYFGAGLTPAYISTITRLDFSSETLSNPGKNLSLARAYLSAVWNGSYGYFGGGYIATGSLCTINRLDFSNETTSDPGNNLPTRQDSTSATQSSSYGYFGGGYLSLPTPVTNYYSTITRFDFSNETNGTLGNYLSVARKFLSAISAGQAILRGNKTYGYFGGGYYGVTPTVINTISRLDFSNETNSLPGNNLLSQRYALSATSSNSYGYFGGGFNPSGTLSTIERLDFSNDTVNLPNKNLPTARRELVSVQSSSYGYFATGFNDLVGYTCTIDRIDFSTETTNASGSINNMKTQSQAVSSDSFGYIVDGGNVPTIRPVGSYKYDFSTQVSTEIYVVLGLSPIRKRGTVSNTMYGYFAGGYWQNPATPSTYLYSTVNRLDFTTTSPSVLPSVLSSQNQNLSGTSSSLYGYFCGGSGGISTIDRLDFSTETIAPAPNLPSARSNLAATSNSN